MRIVQDNPSAYGKVKATEVQRRIDKLVKQFRRDLEKQFGVTDGVTDELMTIDEVEEATLKIRQEIGQAIAEEMTQAQIDAAQEKEKQQGANKCVCHHCLREDRAFRTSKERTIVTMAGEIHLKRRVYYCRCCDCCTMPADRTLSLPLHQFTRNVEIWVARWCMKHPYEDAMEDFRDATGVHVSAKEAQRITTAIGEYAQKAVQADIGTVIHHQAGCHLQSRHPDALGEQYHDPRLTGYVSMDGVIVTMARGPGQEAKLSRIRLIQEPQNPEDKPRVLKNLYSFQFGGKKNETNRADECGRQMYANAARAGITELSRLVATADGAKWIWRRISQYFPHTVQILDWYHALENLSAVIKECTRAELACRSPDAVITEDILKAECATRIEEAKGLMWEGKVAELIHYVRNLPQPTTQAKEKVRQAVVYYRNNQDRMHYDEYRAQGFDIGSGSMESGCKQVVTHRMKQAGMRWGEIGAKAIGTLRALWLSKGRWVEVIGTWPGRDMPQAAPC